MNNTPDTIIVRAEVGGDIVAKTAKISPGQTQQISFKGQICLSDLRAETNQIKTDNPKELKWDAQDGKYKDGNAHQNDLFLSCANHTLKISLGEVKLLIKPLKLNQ